MALKTNRSFFLLLLLTLVTFGIYGLYFIYAMARDVNVACAEDGRKTIGLVLFIVLTIITCGIFEIIWILLLIDRCDAKVRRAGQSPRITIGGYLCWTILGSFIIVGPLVAAVKQLHLLNDVCLIYNQQNGLTY